MKKLVLSLALLVVFAVPVVAGSHGGRGPADNVDICHHSEDGAYHLISVNENALEAHLEHGDGLPGEGQFDENCNLVEGGPIILDLEE